MVTLRVSQNSFQAWPLTTRCSANVSGVCPRAASTSRLKAPYAASSLTMQPFTPKAASVKARDRARKSEASKSIVAWARRRPPLDANFVLRQQKVSAGRTAAGSLVIPLPATRQPLHIFVGKDHLCA